MTTINIRELLAGTEPGTMQSVGLMQVIPLCLPETGTDLVLAPLGELAVSNRNYGEITFRNPAELNVIVPQHAGFITRRAAQDHATPKVVVVEANSQKRIENAACIQESQGGYIIEGDHKMIILPFAMREMAFRTRKDKSYSKLWATIREYNTSLGLQNTGHIEVFFNAYKKQLDQFVAEFESVPRQIGAIILVAGRIVGIERVPTPEYWLEIWETLIRDCYGSLAIYVEKTEQSVPATRIPIIGEPETLDDLAEALRVTEETEKEAVRAGLDELFDEKLDVIESEKNGPYNVNTNESGSFTGQSVHENGNVIYASLIATRERLKKTRSAVSEFVY